MSPESPLSCFDFLNLLRRLHEQINLSHRLFEQGFSNKLITRLLSLNKDLRDPRKEGATHLTRSWRHKRQKSALLLQHIPWPKPEAHEKSLAPRGIQHMNAWVNYLFIKYHQNFHLLLWLTANSTSIGKWLSLILLLDFHTTIQSFGKKFLPAILACWPFYTITCFNHFFKH